MLKITASTFSVLVLLCGQAEAKDLFVNNANSACSDSVTRANNASDRPWCTIGRAAWGSPSRSSPSPGEAAQAGDVVIVAAGTYTNAGTGDRIDPAYNPVNSGTSAAPIEFRTSGVVVLRQTGTGPLVGANGNNSPRNYIKWKGFQIVELNAMSTSDTGPVVLWSTTGSVIEDFTIDGADNGVNGNNHNGIRLENVRSVVIRNNRIFNVLNFGQRQMNGAGIMAYFSDGAIIENNEIFNCGSAVFIKGGNNTNFTVRLNNLHDNGLGVIAQYTGTTGEHRIYQNVVRANETGISVRLYGHNVRVVNNTVVDNTAAGIQVIHWQEPLSNVTIQNNIVRQGSGEVFNGGEATNINAIALDRNSYSGSLRWSIAGAAYSSIASWQTALGSCPGVGNDCAAATSDPLFVNYSGGDYRLQSSSPVRTLAVDVLDLDADGNISESIPAGAYVTGAERIGRSDGAVALPSAPTGLRVIVG